MGIVRMFENKGKRDKKVGEKKLADASFTVVDTELTGLDERKDEIVSIGAVRMEGGRVLLCESYYKVVDPGRGIPGESVVIHGITPTEAAGGASLDEALDGFTVFAGSDVLVGHCISLDLAFINKALVRRRGRGVANMAVDTYTIHHWLKKHSPAYHRISPGPDDLGLYAIARRMGIELMAAHDALSDAYITAQVFQRYIPMLVRAGVTSVDELMEIADPRKGGEVFTPGGEFGNF